VNIETQPGRSTEENRYYLRDRGHWLCSSMSTFYGHRGASK